MYYRCWVPGRFLRRLGYDVRFAMSIADPALTDSSVLVLQRPTSESLVTLSKSARERGQALVCEFDDDLHDIPASNEHAALYADGALLRCFEAVCTSATVLFVSTHALAGNYARLGTPTAVCQNAIDDVHFARFSGGFSAPRRAYQVRIGYGGSYMHGGDFACVAEAVARVLRRYPQVRLVFWGRNYRDQIPEDLWDQTEYYLGTGSQGGLRFDDPKSDEATDRGLASVAYYDLLHRLDLDLGIAPLEPATFNRCKSSVKVMEYGMLGIAALASRFGPYAEYQAEASESVVILAEGTDEWERALCDLVERATWRSSLAAANRAHVAKAHLMSGGVRAWENALQLVGAQRP